MGVHGGEVAAGARREPAAEGGELEGLREVPQRQAVGFQTVLDRGPVGTGLDTGGAAGAVDLEDLVQVGHVEADHARVGIREAPGSTPPVTDDPPPKGTSATPASVLHCRTSTTFCSVRGRTTRSGTSSTYPMRLRITSR